MIDNVGPYDALYRVAGIAWGNKPGRLLKHVPDSQTEDRALDIGCGDLKNAIFLEKRGYVVDAIDISELAIKSGHARLAQEQHEFKGTVLVRDIDDYVANYTDYSIILSYGIAHCLNESQLRSMLRISNECIAQSGLFLFSALTDTLPIPPEHPTGKLFLRDASFYANLFCRWEALYWEEGIIEESHSPLIGLHRHSALWSIWKKS